MAMDRLAREHLDADVKRAVSAIEARDGRKPRFRDVCSYLCVNVKDPGEYRAIDRSLQRLRKARALACERGGFWTAHVTSAA